MNTSTRIAATAAALLSCSLCARAQVAQGGQPLGLERPFKTNAPLLVVPPPDVEAHRAEDEARGHRPLRYGALVDIAADLSDGAWTSFPDGSRAWRLEVVSPGARSVGLEFSRFDLPAGARFYVYDGDGATVLGAYTAENRHADGGFVFEPFPGQRMTLGCSLPQNMCSTSPNSVGPGAIISWSGSQSKAANNFHLLASGCPPTVFGTNYYGATPTQVPYGNGFRCIASPIVRLPVLQTDAAGNTLLHVNLAGSQIDPGETWYFQLFYRNTAAGGAGFNLSDALAVPFCD